MQYIVLDLEWNQPLSYQSRTFQKIGDQLMFEVIQIGAVRLDENLDPTESISIPIAPTHYIQIHPRIRRMTGLDADTLAGAPAFREGLEQFVAWCGEDYTLLTWGCDDVSVLWQNITFFQCEDIPLPPLCDMQRLFSDARQMKDRVGLKTALELTGIEPEEGRAFHNALNDAWYTALIFKTLPDPNAVLNYARQPKKLTHTRAILRHKAPDAVFDTVEDALASEAVSQPVCPRCGRVLALDGEYVKQRQDQYVAIARCKNHGRQLIRLRFRPDDDGRQQIRLTFGPATATQVAYVHTKQLQLINNKEEEAHDHSSPE